MNLSCAQDEFQWAIDRIFQDIANVFHMGLLFHYFSVGGKNR